jgi:hypothetical protein
MFRRLIYLMTFVLVLAVTGTASAGRDITVPDAGFEDTVLALGEYTYVGEGYYDGTLDYPGPWQSAGGDAWIQNHYYDDGLQSVGGNNYLFAAEEDPEDYTYQILDETFIEGATYTLSVWTGHAWDGYDTSWALYFTGEDYTNNLVETSGTAPVGSWEQVSLVYTATLADAGKKIGIKLNGGPYLGLDEVALSYLGPPAQGVTVPDAGFDDSVLSAGSYTVVGEDPWGGEEFDYPGPWQSAGDAWIGSDYYSDGLPPMSGNNQVYGYDAYIHQILDETFIEGATYTLSVWTGILWSGYDDGWWLYFTGEDSTDNLIETSGSAPAESWEQVNLVYTATMADAGKKIGIKMYGDGYVSFDEVTLSYLKSATQGVTVPDAGFEDTVLAVGEYMYVGEGNWDGTLDYPGPWQSAGGDAWIQNHYYGDDLLSVGGDNFLFGAELTEDYVYQILDETFISGATYTLSVWVGHPWDGYDTGWALYFTGEDYTDNLIETSGSAPVGSWEQVSLVYTATMADAGKKMGIKLQGDFYLGLDEVALSYLAPPAQGVIIPDAGFDDTVLDSGGYMYVGEGNWAGDIDYPGPWQSSGGDAWIVNHYYDDLEPPVSGDQQLYAHELAEDYIYQILDETFISGATYTLSVWTAMVWPGYGYDDGWTLYFTGEDYADNLIETSGNIPVGEWEQVNLVYTATAADGGKKIGIKMYGDRYMTFDEVALSYATGGIVTAPREPDPVDGAVGVPLGSSLSWTPGDTSVKSDVYFGTTDPPAFAANVEAAPYYPGPIEPDTTYYWQVDAVEEDGTTKHSSEVWSFTSGPLGYIIDGITATASSSFDADQGPEKTIDGSGLADDLHSTEATDMWLSGGEPNAWIEYELDKVHKLNEMWVWNSNQAMELAFGFGLKDVTIDHSTDGTDYTTLAGVPEFAQAPGTPDYAYDTVVDFNGVTAQFVRLTANSRWGAFMPQSGLSEVRLFGVPPDTASKPSPADGAEGVPLDATLGWWPGINAVSHTVYLATSATGSLAVIPTYLVDGDSQTFPWVVGNGTISFDGEISDDGGDPDFISAGASGNTLDIPDNRSWATLSFDFDVDSVQFIYGGNFGNITVEARDIGGTVIDSLYQADTSNEQPAGPVTLSGSGIRSLYWKSTSSLNVFAALDNILLTPALPPGLLGDTKQVSFDPGALQPSTTYYWQIDTVEADGTIRTGAIWSFTTPIGEATQPDPADGAEVFITGTVLSWLPGITAATHDVYFGTTSPPPLIGNQTDLSFDTGILQAETVYYWQVDEIEADGTTVYTGDIWSFTTSDTIEISIATGNDDVEQFGRGNPLEIGSSDLEILVDPDYPDISQVIGLRFVDVQIPSGATIVSAAIRFDADDVDDAEHVGNTYIIIGGELSPDAAAFENIDFNVSDRPGTTAQVQWTSEPWPVDGGTHQKALTADISTIIQEIVDQDGWAAGNALVLILSQDPANPSEGHRECESFDGAGDNADQRPTLLITISL